MFDWWVDYILFVLLYIVGQNFTSLFHDYIWIEAVAQRPQNDDALQEVVNSALHLTFLGSSGNAVAISPVQALTALHGNVVIG